jgi:hypothetical protein
LLVFWSAMPMSPGMSQMNPLDFHWERDGNAWRLRHKRRRIGRVVPDQKYPGMWRPVLFNGRLGDMANVARAKDAVLKAAYREVEYEQAASDPSKCPEKWGVFQATASPVR